MYMHVQCMLTSANLQACTCMYVDLCSLTCTLPGPAATHHLQGVHSGPVHGDGQEGDAQGNVQYDMYMYIHVGTVDTAAAAVHVITVEKGILH